MKHSYLKHILLCLCLFAGAKTFAYVEIDGIYYNIPIYGNNVSVTSCNRQYSGSVVIPSSVTYNSETYNVTSIGDYAFRDCSGLTSVTIPNSVTSIGGYAFQNCTGLTSITIPGSVTDTGYEAFNKCTGLTSVTIQNGVTRIGKGSFSDCKGLTSISIPNSVTSIGSWAFSYCQSLTDVYCYAENVPSTDSDAFIYSPISSATLHVPAGSVNSYKSQSPWSIFGSIVAIE